MWKDRKINAQSDQTQGVKRVAMAEHITYWILMQQDPGSLLRYN